MEWVALLGAMAAFGKKTGRRIALAGLAAFAIGFVCWELTKEMTMRPRPFAVLDHACGCCPQRCRPDLISRSVWRVL